MAAQAEGFYPRGVATGVGSLPYTNGSAALAKVWQSVPFAPYWPQLPQRGEGHWFLGQCLNALAVTGVIENGLHPVIQKNASDWPERVSRFYAIYAAAKAGEEEALGSFAFPEKGGEEFAAFCLDLVTQGNRQAILLKGQLCGPITLGMYVTDPQGIPANNDPLQRDMLVKAAEMHAQWQVMALARSSGFSLPIILAIDEPGLYAYQTGTADFPERGQMIAALNAVADGILIQGGIPAIHVCGETDWTLCFESHIRVINFDAYGHMEKMLEMAGPLNRFLSRRGMLAWGIIPTGMELAGETSATLQKRLEDNIARLAARGVDERRLRERSILTPVCGAGTLNLEWTEKINTLLTELNGILVQGLSVVKE